MKTSKSKLLKTIGIPLLILGVLLFGISRQQLPVDTTQSVIIEADREDIWEIAIDFEGAFENSNPAHRGTEILSEPKQPFRDSLRFYQKEKVGGITAELDGTVYDVNESRSFRWKAKTIYYFLGMEIPVDERGTFRIEETTDKGYRVSHRIYGNFKDTFGGRTLSWLMVSCFGMLQSAAEHTLVELEYFKEQLEG